jgi:hypothetical protein
VTGDSVPVLSHEHRRLGLFTEPEVPRLAMPDGYKRSIPPGTATLRAGGSACRESVGGGESSGDPAGTIEV